MSQIWFPDIPKSYSAPHVLSDERFLKCIGGIEQEYLEYPENSVSQNVSNMDLILAKIDSMHGTMEAMQKEYKTMTEQFESLTYATEEWNANFDAITKRLSYKLTNFKSREILARLDDIKEILNKSKDECSHKCISPDVLCKKLENSYANMWNTSKHKPAENESSCKCLSERQLNRMIHDNVQDNFTEIQSFLVESMKDLKLNAEVVVPELVHNTLEKFFETHPVKESIDVSDLKELLYEAQVQVSQGICKTSLADELFESSEEPEFDEFVKASTPIEENSPSNIEFHSSESYLLHSNSLLKDSESSTKFKDIQDTVLSPYKSVVTGIESVVTGVSQLFTHMPMNTTLQRKKSLPDVQQLPATAPPMSREEVSALGSARREEVRRIRDENDRLKANPLLYLVSPQVKDWFSRQQLVLLVLVINIILAFMFIKMLT